MIDPTFSVINRFFVISFKNSATDPVRNPFVKYNMSLVEMKDL